MRPAITRHTLRLHDAILHGDEDRAADEARYLARWRRMTRPVTLPEPMPRRLTNA